MWPVKNQGSCGSCWAFAAVSVMEAMQAIEDRKKPVRLSEQEAVDCVTKCKGCDGGWMVAYWRYARDGARAYDDYPEYDAEDHRCRTRSRDRISSTTKDWDNARSVSAMVEKL